VELSKRMTPMYISSQGQCVYSMLLPPQLLYDPFGVLYSFMYKLGGHIFIPLSFIHEGILHEDQSD
jgi:hypothetical protein